LSSAARASPWRIAAAHHPSYGVGTTPVTASFVFIGIIVTLPTSSRTVELQRGTVGPSLRRLKVCRRDDNSDCGDKWCWLRVACLALCILARPLPRTSPRAAALCPVNVEFRLEARTGGTIFAGAVDADVWDCVGSGNRVIALSRRDDRVEFFERFMGRVL